MIKKAKISSNNKYRYTLERIWDDDKDKVLFIMLNPSTADASKDDATIRKCMSYANDWGYGGIYVGNLFAYRSRDPELLLKVKNPVGVFNNKYLSHLIYKASLIICAWGNYKILKKLSEEINVFPKVLNSMSERLYCIELTKEGIPKHPLYLARDKTPINYDFVSSFTINNK